MNLQPINPPSQHTLPGACTSCGGEVRCDNGFADLDGEPFKAYLCAGCAKTATLQEQADEQGATVAQLQCKHEWNQTPGEADESGGRIYCLKCDLDGDA